MLLLALALACSTHQTPAPDPAPPTPPAPVKAGLVTPVFGPLVDGGPRPGVVSVIQEVTLNGKTAKVTFQPLLETGVTYEGKVFGELVDENGEPMPWPEDRDAGGAENRLCNVGDFGSLIVAHDQLFHLGHMECAVGGVSITPLTQTDDGGLTAGAPQMVDLKEVHGTSTPCSGIVTPWNTHLASEEYDANARLAGKDGLLEADQMDMAKKHPSEWSFHNRHLAYRADISPYDYGWIPEIEITDAKGSTHAVKHYAMGRFSHELGMVMPDQRTVYLTDDQYHGGFFAFVADKKADLSAGTLYAARWQQKDTDGNAGLDWISLGHATDAELKKTLFEKRPHFTDLFESADLVDNACPEGFGRTTTAWGTECLKVLDPLGASRFEARRYAGLVGATTEFTKNEGLALDAGSGPDDGRLYIAMTKIDVSMLDETDKSMGPEGIDYRRTAEQDHVKLTKNSCGIVFALTTGEAVDSNGDKIDSPWVLRTATPTVVGTMIEGGCAPDGIANPDNLTFIDDYGLLVIGEDTSQHDADTLWVIDPRKGGPLIPIMRVDKGSEVTGVHWFSDINGWSYLTVSNQWDDSDWPAHKTVMGVLGPFPAR